MGINVYKCMKTMKQLFKDNMYYIYGILVIICATLAICFSTIAHFVSGFIILHWIFEIVAIFMYHLFYNGMKKQHNQKAIIQCIIINYILLIAGLGILVRCFSLMASKNGIVYLVSIILFSLGTFGICISDYFFDRKNIGNTLTTIGSKIGLFIKQNVFWEILCFVGVLIAILCSGNQPRWDSAYLFRYLNNCSIYSIFYIPQLSFISHINFSYSALNLIAEVLVGDLWLGMTILNVFIFVLSAYSIYGILQIITPNGSKLTHTLGATGYMVSPFLLGMVNNNYWDYWVLCLFPILFWLILKKYWIWETVVGFIFCFIKETAFLTYAFLCLGILVSEYIELRGVSNKTKVLKLIKSKKYWTMLLTGLTWIGMYIIMPNWDGNGGIIFDKQYILSKLSVLFGINFNWILFLFGGIAMIGIFTKKQLLVNNIHWIFPLLFADFGFILFSILFVTVNHARYIDVHFPILYICAFYGMCMISRAKVRNAFLGILCILFLLQSFYTLDPITKILFKNYNVGSTVMVSATQGEFLADSMVYNQQFQYFDRALNLAMKDIVDKKDAKLFFPAIHNKTWCFDGFAETTEEVKEYYVSHEYWDDTDSKRCILADEGRNPIEIYNITEEADLQTLLDGRTGYYFYVDFAGENIADIIRRDDIVHDEKSYEYRGWKVSVIEFE